MVFSAHADDFPTHSTSLSDVKLPISPEKSYTDFKGQKLCPEKCGVVIAAPHLFEPSGSLEVHQWHLSTYRKNQVVNYSVLHGLLNP